MSNILSFLNIDDFISNTDGVVNPVGELSTIGATYDREVKIYPEADVNYRVFHSDTEVAGELAVIDAVHVEVAGKLNGIPVGILNVGTTLAEVTTILGAGVSLITVGSDVVNPGNALNYPSWIQFTITSNGYDWVIKVWLVDAVFLTEYTQGQVEVVLPLNDLSILHTNYPLTVTTIDALDSGSLITKAATQITDPLTGYKHLTLELFNVNDLGASIQIPFLIGYNGPLSVNTDTVMIAAIQVLLEAADAYTLAEWIVIIPDLVPVNTFRVVCGWGNIAVDNIGLAAPLCSPTINLVDGTSLAASYWSGVTEAAVLSHLQYTVALYKSIGMFILPDESNPDGRLKWKEKLADYLVIATNDSNISQLDADTQTAIVTLDQMLRLAESYETGDTLDSDVTKETYGAYEYLTKRVLTIKLTVLTRESYLVTPT